MENNETKEIKNAKEEVEKAKAELEKAMENLKTKRATLKLLEGKPREKTKRYIYIVKTDTLKELYKDQTVIYGVKDLFKRVLEVKNEENGEIIDLDKTQVSVRIRTQGMKKVEEYCTIKQESPRIFYIKTIKDRESIINIKASDVNLKELNRHIKIEEQKAKLDNLKSRKGI